MTPDRYWLLTWTTYATWLPGDQRGFVCNVAGDNGRGVRHNDPGTPYDADVPALREYTAARLAHDPVRLDRAQAAALIDQFRETAAYRGWLLLAAAVMGNHVHLVAGVTGDPQPDELLRDFKAYGSRRLNAVSGRREKWWTQGGSTRKPPGDAAVVAATRYVQNQAYSLAVWVPDPGEWWA